jgi:hypothetical protein
MTTATTPAPFQPGDRVTRRMDGAAGTVESVTAWDSETGSWAIAVRLDQDGQVWSGTEVAWAAEPAETATVEGRELTVGHVLVDYKGDRFRVECIDTEHAEPGTVLVAVRDQAGHREVHPFGLYAECDVLTPGTGCGTGSDGAACSPAYLCPACIQLLLDEPAEVPC